MLNGLLSALGFTPAGRPGIWTARQQSRLENYVRFKKLYDGYAYREVDNVNQYKKLKFNLSRPVANMGANFLAAKPIQFIVADDEEATLMCDRIWTESGGGAEFMDNALLATILGDACIMVTKKDDEEVPCLRWIDPSICYPDFDPHDYKKLVGLTISYDIFDKDGKVIKYSEVWKDGKVEVKNDTKIVENYTYDEETYGGVPAVWIRNQSVKGELFGRSDLDAIVELVELYDHTHEKQNRIIDYYSAPNLFVKGVTKRQMEIAKTERTMYFIPTDGEIGFIEWSGTPPGIDKQIANIRESISEISETPRIAFGAIDSGISNVSGVALRIMYGPLMAKTVRKRQSWGPALERAMHMALMAQGMSDVRADMIQIEWQDPLPDNETEFWQVGGEKEMIGVSKRQVLREAGYTEDQIEQFEKEKKEEQQNLGSELLKQFSAGNVPGTPYPPQEDGKTPPPGQKKGEAPAPQVK